MALSRGRAMIAPWGTGITQKSSDKARKRLFRNPLPCQPLHQASATNHSKKPRVGAVFGSGDPCKIATLRTRSGQYVVKCVTQFGLSVRIAQ